METTIHIGGRKHIEPSSVIFMVADINYTKLFLKDGKSLYVATPLKRLQERFQAAGDFFRPNRGIVVNMDYVADLTEVSITLENNKTFKISRRRQPAFLSRVK